LVSLFLLGTISRPVEIAFLPTPREQAGGKKE
jgi:hypothetical protein